MGNSGSGAGPRNGAGAKQFEYEWDEIDPTSGVVEAVAATTGKEMTALTPLYQEVDPDALNALVSKLPTGEEPIEVSFTYSGQKITVDNAGVVTVGALNGAADTEGSTRDH
jgi:hypothetical protein